MRLMRVALTGFKSFVEETTLDIGPGLTGIVGPNGCGKSNVVEAVRWVMGEHAPRSIRAAEMDDVIFDGTVSRPARNVAEIRLILDNEDRSAPAPFNDSATIEVSRRIRRGQGSSFFVNGSEVRARDVQLLFADSALGARSHAIVSQGQVGAIVTAKPADRRRLLEEAAGVLGVHSRRHEAELRLRSTDENLARLDDLLGARQTSLADLRRQARQAARYRSVSDRLRTADARLSLHRWNTVTKDNENANAAHTEADQHVARTTAEVAKENARLASDQDALQSLRDDEAAAAAAVQRLVHERVLLDRELKEVAERCQQLENEQRQATGDLAREEENRNDINREEAALKAEQERIETACEDELETRTRAEAELAAARTVLETAQAAQGEADRALAQAESRAGALALDVDEKARALKRLEDRLAATVAALEDLSRDRTPEFGTLDTLDGEVRAADARCDHAEAADEAARNSLAEAEEAARTAARDLEAARAALHTLGSHIDRLQAERDTLAKQLDTGNANALARQVQIQPGYEFAAAAALGDDLEAEPTDGPVTWRDLGAMDAAALPAQCEPLSKFVSGPPALRRRLAFTGVVETDAGDGLQPQLVPGQRLVDRTGSLWRWDGYTHSSGDATPVSRRFQQKNRFDRLAGEIEKAEEERREARTALARAERTATGADSRHASARSAAAAATEARQAAERERKATRDKHAAALTASVEIRARHASLKEEHGRLEDETALQRQLLSDARTAARDFADIEPCGQEAERCLQKTEDAREQWKQALGAHTRLVELETHRRQRLETILQQRGNWERRRTAADWQVTELRRRLDEIEDQQTQMAEKPQTIESELRALTTRIDDAERQQRAAADLRVAGDAAVRASSQAVTDAGRRLTEAREALARADGTCKQTAERLAGERERIRERLDTTPDGLPALSRLKNDEPLPPREDLERALERLQRERDNVGPVNLRAEAEAAEIAAEIDKLTASRNELLEAIEKFRKAINRLNREARERLRSTFSDIDQHFQTVFKTLFDGGEARLELVDAEDPLEAGLEIVARPPGKTLQKISLLSGGEKSLTALSLIVAMFLTRPAPLCVLDEVDAALDDHNVERFCALVKNISQQVDTRLLIVTHHPFTMTQMDRLYGVTMREPGVSALVSVDLAHAEGLREAS